MNTKGFKGLWALCLAIILIVGLAIGTSADLGKVYLGWINATRLNVSDTTTLTGAVTTAGDLTVGDDLTVTGDTTFTGDTGFTGDTLLDGDISAASALTVTGNLAANGGITAGGGFGNSGCTVSTAGAISCNSNAIIGGTMLVTGTSTFQNIMTVNGNLDADSLSTAGTSDLTTILNTGINPITVNDNLAVTGVLTTTGTSTLDGTTTVGGGFGSAGCTFTDAGVISCNGAATFASTLALTGNATLAGQIAFMAPTQITVTADSTIATAGYTVIPLYSAGAVGTATITGCETAGKLTILRNIANQTITITDTSTIMLGGNAALGQYDTLTLLGDGTNCLQISKADN